MLAALLLSILGAALHHDPAHRAVHPLQSNDPFVQQGGKITAEGASFGASVTLSADGSTMLIGAPGDDGGRGAAWVFTRTGSTWTEQGGELTGGEESGASEFASSVALSADGNTALIGGAGDDGHAGAAWVFTRTGSTWTQQGAKLTGGEEVGQGWFGHSVALSADGETALVGAFHDDALQGAAWVFTRTGSTWTQQGPKLVGSGGCGTPFLGSSVALSADGDTALIGGAWDCDVGAAWVFTRTGSTWTQQGAKLTASGEIGKGFFGESVALSSEGDTALIGAPSDNGGIGAAWVFTRTGSTWTQQGAKLTGSEEIGKGFFGKSVALSGEGDTALIGGAYENTGVNGAAWAFTRSGATWAQQGEKLSGSGEGAEEGAIGLLSGGGFGTSVALSSDASTALIGGGHGAGFLGAAWVFAAQSASPPNVAQFGRCVLVPGVSGGGYTGRYTGAACTKPSKKGSYEWYAGVARTHFTTRLSGSAAALEAAKGSRIVCTGETGTGEYSGATLVTVGEVVLTFTGCERLGQECSSAGAAAGTVLTTALEGQLVITRRGAHRNEDRIGLELSGAGGGEPIAQFSCGATTISLRGSLTGSLAANRMSRSCKLDFSAPRGGRRAQSLPEARRSALEASVGGGRYERIGLKLVTVQTSEEAVEPSSVL